MDKVLILASVASMIQQFNMPNIKILQDMGYEVNVACNFQKGNTCTHETIDNLKRNLEDLKVEYFQIDFSRNILNIIENIKAYNQVLSLFRKNQYKFIHCHSPIGGVVGRLAGHKNNAKVIYTAHGFHFFKGAPIKNWIIYYPVERFLAHFTDVLITINKEDYKRAKDLFKVKKIEYVPGVGIDTRKFREVVIDRLKKRRELKLPEDSFLVLSVGELNKNKNHETVIKAIAKLNNQNVYYIICGQGLLENYLKELIRKLNLEKQVLLLGYRRDIAEISKVADVFVLPSLREGLSVALMEAMALGLPVVCSRIRGNTDLIVEGEGGYLVEPKNVEGFAYRVNEIIKNPNENMGGYNKQAIMKYDISNVKKNMKRIYLNL